jgi:integrase
VVSDLRPRTPIRPTSRRTRTGRSARGQAAQQRGCRPRRVGDLALRWLDRNELGALLVAAGLGSAAEHALISLLALNGLRVSEATGADIEALGVERGTGRW